MKLNLDEIRKQINNIDNEISELYKKRLELCDNVASYKKNTGKAVRDIIRENAIIDRLSENMSENDTKALDALYRKIFEISRARQSKNIAYIDPLFENALKKHNFSNEFSQNVSVSCQETISSYSKIACEKIFKDASLIYFKNCEDIFKSVENGLCKYGIVTFEDNILGSKSKIYDMFSKFNGYIVKSIKIPIKHSILTVKKDLDVFEKNTQDEDFSYVNFYFISKDFKIYKEMTKISFMFNAKNKIDTLCEVLSRLKFDGINLSKIENMNMHRKDLEFMFYIEADIDSFDENLMIVLSEFMQELESFKFLGAYEEI